MGDIVEEAADVLPGDQADIGGPAVVVGVPQQVSEQGAVVA